MGAQEVWISISCYAQKRKTSHHAQNLGEGLDPEVAGMEGRYGRKNDNNRKRDGGWRNQRKSICEMSA